MKTFHREHKKEIMFWMKVKHHIHCQRHSKCVHVAIFFVLKWKQRHFHYQVTLRWHTKTLTTGTHSSPSKNESTQNQQTQRMEKEDTLRTTLSTQIQLNSVTGLPEVKPSFLSSLFLFLSHQIHTSFENACTGIILSFLGHSNQNVNERLDWNQTQPILHSGQMASFVLNSYKDRRKVVSE